MSSYLNKTPPTLKITCLILCRSPLIHENVGLAEVHAVGACFD